MPPILVYFVILSPYLLLAIFDLSHLQVTAYFQLLPDIKFILFKNNIPFGDCRYFDCEKDQAENAHVYKNPKSKAEIAKKAKKAARTARNDRKQWEYREIDEGRIQLYKLQDAKIGSHRDLTGHPKSTLETMEDYHCIVSPSDKMALRAICGCQGALLSLLLKKPVFLTEYHFFANQRLEIGYIYKKMLPYLFCELFYNRT